jgi:ATP-dependent DNA helicase RecG
MTWVGKKSGHRIHRPPDYRGWQEWGWSDAYVLWSDLVREYNLALLKKHIEYNSANGFRLDDLQQVLPSLPETTVRSLLNTLKRRGEARTVGRSRGAKWFPGQLPREGDDA